MKNLLQDFRFAFRQMRRAPGFALTAVLTLALGIAGNVIVFGVVQTMILQPLPVPNPEQVKTLSTTLQSFPEMSFPEVRDVRDDNSVFTGAAAFNVNNLGFEVNGITRPVWGSEVSGQYFQVLGIQPMLGRLLQPSDDDHPGASEAVVISYAAWNNYFGADPAVVGKIVRINKHPYTVVGVTPKGFFGTEKFLQPELFVPMANEASLEGADWLERRGKPNILAIVRMKDGVTLPQAEADLATIASRMRREHPVEEDGLGFKLARPGLIGDYLGGPARKFLTGVMGLAFIVLLAACANLGSLFAARTADRAREISIRMAVGSSRWRILRQVLVEALVISMLGGICACGLAWIALNGLAVWHPPTDFPIHFSVTPQPSLILMALLISVVSGALFGIMPLRQIFKSDPNDAIKAGNGQAAAGKRWALRDVLLAAQIALCCVTVTAAFVSLRGMQRATTMDLGFNPHNAVMTKFDLSQSGYTGDAVTHFQRQVLEKVSQLPGVKAAAYADSTPLSETNVTDFYAQETTEFKTSTKKSDAFYFEASPGYFAAAETPLLEGRDVSFSDTPQTPRVAVVNREFARRFFHSDDPIGRHFKNSAGVSIEVVGLVGNGKYLALAEDPMPAVFFPTLQQPNTNVQLIVRTDGPPAEMVATVRKTIHDLDSSVPLRTSNTWIDSLALNFFPAEVATVALSLFGAFGLLLSIAGTFGLASYTVSKRLRELSIRVALGAQGRQILQAALGRMLILLGTGSLVGITLGLAGSHLLSAIVYQASAQDPLVIFAVALTMVVTAALSVTGPVRRALHVDPAILLREQ
jgi:predicted permease